MAGLGTVDKYWKSIDDFTLSSGIIINPDWTPENGQPKVYLGDTKWKYTKDSTDIKNWVWIQSYLSFGENQLTREKIPTHGKDTYTLQRKASDIKRVALYLDTYVETFTSTTVISIPQNIADSIALFDARFLANGLGGRLRALVTTKSDSIEHDVAFNISGNTVTFDTAITNLAKNDRFELINAFDIIKEGTSEDSLPVDGYVIKHTVQTETAWIKFNPYDKPDIPSYPQDLQYVIIYFNELQDNQPEYVDDDSIAQYGLYYTSQDLTALVLTLEQYELITTEYHKYIKPLEIFTLTTYRPSLPEEGWKIPISVQNVCNGVFTVLDVDWKWVHPYGEDGEAFREITVTLASYVNKLGQILAGLNRKSELSKAVLERNLVQRSFSSRKHVFVYDDASVIPAPVATEITNKFENGFRVSWNPVIATGTVTYSYEVSNYPDFRDKVTGFEAPERVSTNYVNIASPYIILGNTYYVRIKAHTVNGTSPVSNVLTAALIPEERLTYVSNKTGYYNIFTNNAAGTDERQITNNTDSSTAYRWATFCPVNNKFYFSKRTVAFGSYYIGSLDKVTGQEAILTGVIDAQHLAISNDGTMMAYDIGGNDLVIATITGTQLYRYARYGGYNNTQKIQFNEDDTKILVCGQGDNGFKGVSIYTNNLDGSGRLIFYDDATYGSPAQVIPWVSYSADFKRIYYMYWNLYNSAPATNYNVMFTYANEAHWYLRQYYTGVFGTPHIQDPPGYSVLYSGVDYASLGITDQFESRIVTNEAHYHSMLCFSPSGDKMAFRDDIGDLKFIYFDGNTPYTVSHAITTDGNLYYYEINNGWKLML